MRVNEPRNLRSTAKYFSLFIIAICLFGIAAANIQAATLTVDTLADDASLTACTAAADDCSLRGAITAANAIPDDDVIDFSVTGEIVLSANGALPAVASNITISGPGTALLTVRRDASAAEFRIFTVNGGMTVTISGLTISGGKDPVEGGGIRNAGTLTINNSVLSGNSGHFQGGGIFNHGTLIVSNSTLTGNGAPGQSSRFGGAGGGICNSATGTLILNNSTLSYNGAQVGGGISNFGSLTISDSTFSGNSAVFEGGAISGGGTVRNSTLTDNRASHRGGGIFGTANLNSSIVANNSANTGPDIFGTVSSGDYNLIEDPSDCTLPNDSTHNITGVDPMLGPLADNGGPTLTHALLYGSAAIDKGKNTDSFATDQRGDPFPRTINDAAINDADGGDGTDIGAVESNYLVVNTTAQDDDGACQRVSDGDCTLREAIIAANAAPGAQISFEIPISDSGYDSVADRYTITLTEVLPDLDSNMSINGLGSNRLTVKREVSAGIFRIFKIPAGNTVLIARMTISGGRAMNDIPPRTNEDTYGGGIFNNGTLTMIEVTVSGNAATILPSLVDALGGGICNYKNGTLNLIDSTVSGNTANRGGGIYNEVGSRTNIVRSAIISNTASGSSGFGQGGGMANSGGTHTIVQSLFANNFAQYFGGGIHNDRASLTISNSTISGNRLPDDPEYDGSPHTSPQGGGGGISLIGSAVTIYNSTIYNNNASNREGSGIKRYPLGPPSTLNLYSSIVLKNRFRDDIKGVVPSGDHNLIGDTLGPGPLPMLEPLANNGGRTLTHALPCGSPAINQGANPYSLVTDQRGVGFARTVGAATDIGAFELQTNCPPAAANDSYTTAEDIQLTVSAAGVLGNDTDGEGSALTTTLVTGPSNGSLTLNPDGSFKYTPEANFNGSDSFTYKANDGSLDSNVATVNLSVTAVNDEPVNSYSPVSVNEDSSSVLSAGNGNLISVSDVDAGTNPVQVTITLPSSGATGVLTLSTTAGLSFVAGDGTGDSAMSFSGTLAAVNAALNGATFTPTPNLFGTFVMNFSVSDLGNTGTGGVQTGSDTIPFTIVPVNDSPTIAVVRGGSCAGESNGGTMNLLVGDDESSAASLLLGKSSSNTTLVPLANIVFGGSGANRTVSITAVPQKTAQNSVVTITVSDPDGGSSQVTITVFVGTSKKETINGSSGADLILGLNGDDTINAGSGNDLVCGGNGSGTVNAGDGDDTVDGGSGNDVILGGAGRDILIGGQGNDRLEGGEDDDTLTGGLGADFFSGGSGTDTATDLTPSQGDTKDGTTP